MNLHKTVFILLGILMLASCKNEPNRAPGIETSVSEQKEINELTSSEFVKAAFEKSSDSSSIGNMALKNFTAISEFYQSRDYQPVWNDRGLREDLFRSIEAAPEEGLNSEDYHHSYLEQALAHLADLDEEELGLTEIILTDAFFRLSSHIEAGKVNPKDLYGIWDVEVNEPNPAQLLNTAVAQNNLQKVLDSIKPKHSVYLGLKKSLKDYRELAASEDSLIKIEEGESIKPGEEDPRLKSIARRLQQLGYYKEFSADSVLVYNEDFQKEVERFQRQYGIEGDAVIGKGTIENLNRSAKDRYLQILANLERWRWYPRDLGEHYIIVNIPNYRLHIVKDGDTIASHRTMVGTEARKTPVFSDEIEHIVYNPTWTVPPTIKKNDVLPSARKDASYFAKKNMSVFDGSGNRVDPMQVDWKNGKAAGYTIRQEAGAANPLGRVKIIYPNPHMIYLHDTPSKKLFERDSRAQSSGCVRVDDAIGLSKYLLSNNPKYTDEEVEKIINSGRTTTIKVTQPVRVHHLYWTAWRENDSTFFAYDVYKHDQRLAELLAAN